MVIAGVAEDVKRNYKGTGLYKGLVEKDLKTVNCALIGAPAFPPSIVIVLIVIGCGASISPTY